MSVRSVVGRGAGLLAAAAVLAGLGVAAPAAQAVTRSPATAQSAAGYLYEGQGKISTSIRRGSSVVVPLYFMERSADSMQVLATGVRVANSSSGASTGVRVDWYDPFTHRWAPTTGNWGTADSDYWQLPSSEHLMVRPGVWAHVYLRLTFGAKARLGQYYVQTNTPYAYQLWGKTGAVSGYLGYRTLPTGENVNLHA